MFGSVLSTTLEICNLSTFVFIWDSLNKTAIPYNEMSLLDILSILNILTIINLKCLKIYHWKPRKILLSRNVVYCYSAVWAYILPPLRLLPSARFLRHTLGVRINDLVLWILIWVHRPSFIISVSKSIKFDLRRRNSSLPTN